MVMSIQVTNKILNLADLQEKLDRTVFDYVDTTQNWRKAQENLHMLYAQVREYFEVHVDSNGGAIPNSNPYWVLFMDISARLVYFNGLAKQHIVSDLDEATRSDIARAYAVAAKILPNKQFEENEELFEEINKSLQQISNGNYAVEKVSYPLTECLQNFYDYIKTL
ncbi:hypothetical protein AAGS61_19440 [Lysinibacillus sp. KU-BSD001]|uniref:hypothetical protein n=1 Tax=Lysinibacillus sp. KU-BSD001 TaxID=3141328 RepID=UPI0036E64EC3